MLKVCLRCRKGLTSDNFYYRKSDGKLLYESCKKCLSKIRRKEYNSNKELRNRRSLMGKTYYQTNKDKIKLRVKKYADKNRERLRLEHRKYYKEHKEERLNSYLKSNFNITLEQYKTMFREQKGCCAICKKPEEFINPHTKKIQMLAVDHDHVTGKVRGLLCMQHNRGLGLFGDSMKNLSNAIEYLNKRS